jgi:hypothetical protein
MRKPRPEEIFLEEVVRRVTGAVVEHVDDGSAPGMVDALIFYPDGRMAALEITTVGNRKHLEMESFDHMLEVPGTPHWWDLRYPGPLSRRDIERHIPVLIGWMDRLGFEDVSELGKLLAGWPEWQWYENAGVQLRRYKGASTGGRVDILPMGGGGFVDERLEGLCEWVESQQGESWWTSNVEKLARSGHSELHLAVRLHESGMPFPMWMGLWNPTLIQTPEPTGMGPLTDLWILPAYGQTVTRWSARTGWTATVYEPAPGATEG